MAEKFNRHTLPFAEGGINLSVPADECPDGQYPYTLNLYSSRAKTIQPRPGVSSLSIVNSARNSMKRVNSQRFNGDTAGVIRGGINGDVSIDTGFSGNPACMVVAAPAQSPEPWMYAADSSKMRKFRMDGVTKYDVGILPPLIEPSVVLGQPLRKAVNFGPDTSIVPGGIASAAGFVTVAPAGSVIAAVLYDSGTTGWCCITIFNPSNDYRFMGRGALLTLSTGPEQVAVEDVFVNLSSTTVAAIQYDHGTTGFCTIQMATPFQDLDRDQMLFLNASEYVRVISVTLGPDGLSSFRCFTTAAIAVGNSIDSVPSIRAYTTINHTGGETIARVVIGSTLTLAPSTTEGTGTLSIPEAIDLSQISGRPVFKDDYMHISIRVDHPELVLFGRVLLDVDAVTNDFTHNFYYQPFEQNDFTAAARGVSSQTTSQQAAVALQQIRAYDPTTFYQSGGLGEFSGPSVDDTLSESDTPYAEYPISSSVQAVTGSAEWTEFMFKMSTMQRVGSDPTRSLANVEAVRLELTVSGDVQVAVGDWWIGGTFGPDILDSTYGVQGFPIVARCRYRSSITGAISVQSPAVRSGVLPRRNSLMLGGNQFSTDPQVDYVDWEVFGGSDQKWHYAGACSNAPGSTLTYDLTNAAILANDSLSTVAFKPFPVSDTPKHSVVNVAGTSVTWVSGDKFNVAWAAGGQIQIGGKIYTLWAPPDSDTRLYVVENIGALVNAAMVFAEPTIMAQPLPVMWGPDQNGRYFGAGDTLNPGKVYPTNADQDGGIDGASDQTVIEVTDPSDPVMNGAILGDESVVLTSQTVQVLQPTPVEQNISYVPLVLERGNGLYGRYGMCVYGGFIWYVSNDGIYRWSRGTGSTNITEERLGPLFPHNSVPGSAVTRGNVVVSPPDFTRQNDLRLSGANGYIFFDYIDTNGARFTLAYRIANGSWWLWKYGLGGAVVHYQEEGQNINTTLVGMADGTLALMSSGNGDNGAAIECAVCTPAFDEGDPRNPKVWGDAWVKLDTRGVGIQISAAADDLSLIVALGPPVFTNSADSVLLDLVSSRVGDLKRNLALLLNWSTTSPDSATQTLFYWEFGPWEIHPLRVQNWQSQPTTHGMDGFQHMRELWIPYQSDVPFNFLVNADGKQYSYAFPASGPNTVKMRIDTDPIKGKLWVYGTTGGPASIFLQGIEAKLKMWGSAEGYVSVKPFVS